MPDPALQKFLSQFQAPEPAELDNDGPFSDLKNRQLVPEGERKCPICSQAMQTELHEGVKIDCCPEHGIWLDHGELEIISWRIDQVRDRIVDLKMRDAYERGKAHGRTI